MALPLWASIAIGVGGGFVVSFLLLIVWWLIATSWLRPAMMGDKYVDILVTAELANFFGLLFYGLGSIPLILFNASAAVVQNFTSGALMFFALGLLAGGSLVWNEYSPAIVETIIVVRQCYFMPLMYGFLLPVFNIIVMVYDSAIPIVDFYVDLNAFYWYGFPIIMLKCTAQVDLLNLLAYLSNVFNAFFLDLDTFLVNNFITAEWNILRSLDAFGLFIDALVPPFNCFCLILNPLWVAVSLWANLPSLHFTINCLWNSIVRILQLAIATLQAAAFWILPGPSPVRPDFTNATLDICCTFYQAGDAIEDTVFILLEMFFGLFSNPTLPPELLTYVSQPYMLTLSSPLCSITKLVNMTLVLMVNVNTGPTGFLAPDGSGISYLQFGFIADELKPAGIGLSSLAYVFNVQTQAAILQLWYSIVDLAQFILEWILGNLFFFIYNGPTDVLPLYTSVAVSGIQRTLNFLFQYFPNYWVRAPPGGVPITLGGYTYSSALFHLYDDTFILAEALGDLVGLINNALGCATEHILKTLITLISLLCNLISFFVTILTAQPSLITSAHAIDVDPFFAELSYVAGCMGELVSQFGNCTETQNQLQNNLFCCTGTLITLAIDTFVTFVQQMVYFYLDIVTLPTGLIEPCLFGAYNPDNTTCLRIPNLAQPIKDLNDALCAFSCALANIIPVTILLSDFNCVFPPQSDAAYLDLGGIPEAEPFDDSLNNPLPVVPCASVTSCIANVICSTLQILTVPLTLLNQFFIQIIQGNPFQNLYAYLNNSGQLVATAIGNAADGVAMLIDCAICAFAGTNGPIPPGPPNPPFGDYCSPTFFTIMHYLFVVPVIQLAGAFGLLAFVMTRLTISLITDLFTGFGYIGLQNFLVNFFRLIGVASFSSNVWLVTLLGRMGLWELGSFINALYYGVCDMLNETINLLIVESQIVSLGLIEVPGIFMCCDELIACVPFEFYLKKRDDDGGQQQQQQPTAAPDHDMTAYNEYQTNGNTGTARQFPTFNGTTYLRPNTWLDFIVVTFPQVFNWPADDACNATIAAYGAANWTDLSVDDRQHVFFCVYKRLWWARSDNLTWTTTLNDTCNVMMSNTTNNAWASLRVMEKATINDCIVQRYYVDQVRSQLRIPWFPQDWSNFNRRVSFFVDLWFSSKIYFQYFMDRNTAAATVMTQAYQQQYTQFGLNVSFYGNLTSVDDVTRLLSQYTEADYFAWNRHSAAFPAASWITTTAWKFIGNVSADIAQVLGNMGSMETSPSVYMSYGFTGGVAGASLNGLISALMGRFFASVAAFAQQWSNPALLKKRTTFLQDVVATASNIKKGTLREVHLMTAEWWRSVQHQADVIYGTGNATAEEHQQYVYEFEQSIHGLDEARGRHSIIYRLGEWWSQVEMPTVSPIPNPRDGKFRGNNTPTSVGTFYHSYIDAETGETKRETISERIYRWVALVRAGTPESNVRVAKLTASYTMIKNRVFSHFLKRRIDSLHAQHKAEAEAAAKAAAKAAPAAFGGGRTFSIHATAVDTGVLAPPNTPGVVTYSRRPDTGEEQQQQQQERQVCEPYDDACLAFAERQIVSYTMTYDRDKKANETPLAVLEIELRLRTLEQESAAAALAAGFTEPSRSPRVSFSRFSDDQFTRQALIHVDGLLTPTCISNITFLCTECFYLDQLVGRVLSGVNVGVVYYMDGQYADALSQAADFFAYEADPFANARLGDSLELPQRWPWAQFSNWRIVGDDTPNKLGFSDITNATQNIIDQYNASINNSALLTNPPGGLSGLALTVILAIPPFYTAMVFFYNLIVFIFSPTGVSDATSSGTFILEQWVLCPWTTGTAWNGLYKRFSIGETFLMFIVVYVVVMVVGLIVFRMELWSAVIGTSLSLFLFLFTYLSITYNWAWLCWPGLPYQFLKDINYFFVNTLFTKCEWWFSGPIIGEYTNSNCYSCAFAQSVRLDQCSAYFPDVFDNVIFFLEYFAPGVIQWLRDTTTPLYIIYQIPAVNQKLNEFANLNLDDPTVFALYWSCGTIFSLVTNSIIGAFDYYVVSAFFPVASAGLAIGLILFGLGVSALLLLYFILQSFFVMIQMQAFFVTGLTETTMAGSDGTTNNVVGGDGTFNAPSNGPGGGPGGGGGSFSQFGSSAQSSVTTGGNGGRGGRQNMPRDPPPDNRQPTTRHLPSMQQQQQQQRRYTQTPLTQRSQAQHHSARPQQQQQQQQHIVYDQQMNGRLSLNGVKNILDRTRMTYFGGDEKTK